MNTAYIKTQIEACQKAYDILLPVLPILTGDEQLKMAQQKMEDARLLLLDAKLEFATLYNKHS